jgi:hypothetical protein
MALPSTDPHGAISNICRSPGHKTGFISKALRPRIVLPPPFPRFSFLSVCMGGTCNVIIVFVRLYFHVFGTDGAGLLMGKQELRPGFIRPC